MANPLLTPASLPSPAQVPTRRAWSGFGVPRPTIGRCLLDPESCCEECALGLECAGPAGGCDCDGDH